MTHLALIFPGQGSQKVGMGKDLAENFAVAKQVFEEVDEALSQKLSQLMFEGDQSELTMTANAQPALMACSVAAFRVLKEEAGLSLDHVVGLAGHSLGEYSAHACAGSFDLTTTAKLLRIRGNAMQSAMPLGQGAMAAILGLSIEELEKVAKEAGVEIANDNCPGQVVISGPTEAIDRACAAAKDAGAKRALKLDVSAAFHSKGMLPAQEKMAEALAEAAINAPQRPVVANIDASLVTEPDEVRRTLTEQVSGRVRWQDCVRKLEAEGATTFVELGAGKVLSGLVKKIAGDVQIANFGETEELDAVKALLGN
ncbi:ACP S-malonyltransferase [Parvularcula lutaonensis]|uniref:Malonyl CoA-acyl carrier protein transacylase n=1 Tax=Parvularcula lutaonensis TaxID=491923 RepID=A0ABV7M8E7_9PROT|nr:ACP S-malonyltransferase [Parvularcula lutaonensis]GGY42645.1 malonyl CoA-acyl carrier protein transacylase [Parvularcula lutaonensis]